MPRGGLRGFDSFRCDPNARDPRERIKKPDAPRCKTPGCGTVLRKGNTVGYCNACYKGEIDLPELLVEVAEEADYIEQIANLLRDKVMSPKAKKIYREMRQSGSTKEG